MDCLISFIVPVYNAEKYLKKCVDSILTQINDTCEIILVDDGSKDQSSNICDDYSNYSNIVVKHVSNGGPSRARNIGMSIARGKYVSFIDSDDYISSGSIKHIQNYIIAKGNADLIFMRANKVFPDGKTQQLEADFEERRINDKKYPEVISYLGSRLKFSGSACTKLFRNEFLKNNKISFPENGYLCEDLVFVMHAFAKAQTFYSLNIDFYNYRQDVDMSRSSNKDSRFYEGCLYFINYSIDLLTCDRVPKNTVCKDLMSFVAYEYAQMVWLYSVLSENEKNNYKKRIKEIAWVLGFGQDKKLKLVYWMYRSLGLNITSKMLILIKKYI